MKKAQKGQSSCFRNARPPVPGNGAGRTAATRNARGDQGYGAEELVRDGAAMILPVIPNLCLGWFGITESAQCGGCALTFVTMYALMRYRRSEYSMQM